MQAFICTTCGTQYAPTAEPPAVCTICEEERQFVPPAGQTWTVLDRLAKSHYPIFRYQGELLAVGIMLPSASTSALSWFRSRKASCCGTASAS
jgi:hypothetical protein